MGHSMIYPTSVVVSVSRVGLTDAGVAVTSAVTADRRLIEHATSTLSAQTRVSHGKPTRTAESSDRGPLLIVPLDSHDQSPIEQLAFVVAVTHPEDRDRENRLDRPVRAGHYFVAQRLHQEG
jgi:hypothetical protein